MGIELVKLLLVYHAPRLSGRAFKVLTYMAMVALDRPNEKGQPARLYFAGEEPLRRVLYSGTNADGGEIEYTSKQVDNQLREVRRMLEELRTAGLIKRVHENAAGKSTVRRGTQGQTFRLLIGISVAGESAHPNAGESAHPNAGESAPQSRGKSPTPRKEAGTTEDLSEDTIPHLPAPSTDRATESSEMDDVEISDEPHAFEPDDSGLSCARCRIAYNLHSSRRAS